MFELISPTVHHQPHNKYRKCEFVCIDVSATQMALGTTISKDYNMSLQVRVYRRYHDLAVIPILIIRIQLGYSMLFGLQITN